MSLARLQLLTPGSLMVPITSPAVGILTVNGTVTLATFKDGTSNTVIFSEWIKGGFPNPYPPGQGLAIVYYYPN